MWANKIGRRKAQVFGFSVKALKNCFHGASSWCLSHDSHALSIKHTPFTTKSWCLTGTYLKLKIWTAGHTVPSVMKAGTKSLTMSFFTWDHGFPDAKPLHAKNTTKCNGPNRNVSARTFVPMKLNVPCARRNLFCTTKSKPSYLRKKMK